MKTFYFLLLLYTKIRNKYLKWAYKVEKDKQFKTPFAYMIWYDRSHHRTAPAMIE